MASVINSAVKKEVLDHQDREKHEKLRNFSFSVPNKRPYAASGAMNETVLEALERSGKFKSHVKKNRAKDILIVRKKPHHADLAPHFPCCLIEEGEEFSIRLSLKKTSVLKPDKRVTVPEQLVTFYVSRAGGPNFKRKHLKNMGNQDIPYLCIYAYQGETVKEALERDGRFEEIVFEEGSELFCIEDSLTVEMCYRVNELMDGKRYRLKKEKTFSAGTLESGSRPANQPAGPSDSGSRPADQPAGPSDSGSRPADQPAGPSREQAKSTPGSEKSGKAKPSVGVKRKFMRPKLSPDYHPIPSTEELLQDLRGKLDGLVEHMMKSKKVRGRKEVQELLREEFGNNTEPFWDVNTGMRLMDRSRSVCCVYNNEIKMQGSGFLLFNRLVLTNAHLIQKFRKISSELPVQLIRPRTIDIHVNFNYEPGATTECNVKRLVFGAYGHDEKMGHLDYAFLELKEDPGEIRPAPLLPHYAPPALSGGICLIGHPSGNRKKFDFSSIIECENREGDTEVKKQILRLMTGGGTVVPENSELITYTTCFYHGSSGSPVFNVDGQVFAMHSGGFTYRIWRHMNVIEWAIPLRLIFDHLMDTFKSQSALFQLIFEGTNDPLHLLTQTLSVMPRTGFIHQLTH